MARTTRDTTAHELLFRTTNYDQFDLAPENREIDRSLVKDEMRSMERHGFVKGQAVLCERRNGRLWLWDGQHRYAAAKNLGIPLWYKIEKYDPQLLIDLNKPKRTWKPKNYMHHYSVRGFKQYERLAHFISETGIPIGCAVGILAGAHSGMSQWRQNQFADGKFEIADEASGYRVAAILNKFRDHHIPWSRKDALCTASSKAITCAAFDETRLDAGLDRIANELEKPSTAKQAVKILERLHNYGRQKRNWLYLETELLKSGVLGEEE